MVFVPVNCVIVESVVNCTDSHELHGKYELKEIICVHRNFGSDIFANRTLNLEQVVNRCNRILRCVLRDTTEHTPP
jgi:hypothetical protein